jgi:hypothetical protein
MVELRGWDGTLVKTLPELPTTEDGVIGATVLIDQHRVYLFKMNIGKVAIYQRVDAAFIGEGDTQSAPGWPTAVVEVPEPPSRVEEAQEQLFSAISRLNE